MTTHFHVATRGIKYSIALEETVDGTFQIREYKHGYEVGCFSMGAADYATALDEYNNRIDMASQFDGINYVVKVA